MKKRNITSVQALLFIFVSSLLALAAGITPTGTQMNANINGNNFSLTNAATVEAANIIATNGISGPVASTNIVGTITNGIASPSITLTGTETLTATSTLTGTAGATVNLSAATVTLPGTFVTTTATQALTNKSVNGVTLSGSGALAVGSGGTLGTAAYQAATTGTTVLLGNGTGGTTSANLVGATVASGTMTVTKQVPVWETETGTFTIVPGHNYLVTLSGTSVAPSMPAGVNVGDIILFRDSGHSWGPSTGGVGSGGDLILRANIAKINGVSGNPGSFANDLAGGSVFCYWTGSTYGWLIMGSPSRSTDYLGWATQSPIPITGDINGDTRTSFITQVVKNGLFAFTNGQNFQLAPVLGGINLTELAGYAAASASAYGNANSFTVDCTSVTTTGHGSSGYSYVFDGVLNFTSLSTFLTATEADSGGNTYSFQSCGLTDLSAFITASDTLDGSSNLGRTFVLSNNPVTSPVAISMPSTSGSSTSAKIIAQGCGITSVTSIAVGNVSSDAAIDLSGNSLTTFDFSAGVISSACALSFTSNPSLASVTAGDGTTTGITAFNNGNLSFSGCGLDNASENGVMTMLAATSCTGASIDISGGTNASPDSTGASLVTSLLVNGNMITTN